MAVDGIVLEKFRQEGDLVLKRRLASSNPPSTFDTPRASSVSSVPSSVKSTPRRNRERPTKYVSQMAKAREEKKRAAREASSHSDKSTTSLSSDMETSSNPSSASGNSLQSGDKPSALPKFGEWVNHSANSGPCYTLLFQNAAQEKKIGGPVPVHEPVCPAPNEDLYGYHRSGSVRKPRKRQFYGLLFCFTCTESS